MRANHDLSRVSVSFDETNLVPDAGLLPAAMLAQRLDLAGLIDKGRPSPAGPDPHHRDPAPLLSITPAPTTRTSENPADRQLTPASGPPTQRR